MFVSTHGFWSRLFIAAVLLTMFSASSIASNVQSFDLDAGDADLTLKQFAKQARLDIVYDPRSLEGVQTQEVVGMLLPSDALERMLEGTPLVFNEDLETGAFAVMRSEISVANQTTQNTESQIMEETEMNVKKNNWIKSLAAVLTLGIAGGPNAISGQDNVDQEPLYELSPFTVDASEDTGYSATSTLAGTRIRTDLKDLGASISVVTTEFMEDTGATDAATLLSYVANAEVGGYQGNFSGGEPGSTGRIMQVNERTNPQFNTRMRGLGSADLTRNLYLTEIPFDSYNTDRITVSRGPNSLLFGIGSPAGVIDNSLKQAIHNSDFGEVKVRFDNYGSLRSELDLNTSLVDGRVALRLAGLYDDAEYKQEPAWNRDKRLYADLDIVLLANEQSDVVGATVLKMNGEMGNSVGSPVEIIPPSIAYHGWYEPVPAAIEQFTGLTPSQTVVSPSEGGSWVFQETYNPFERSSENQINTNVHPNLFRQSGIFYRNANDLVPDVGTGDGLQAYVGLIPWNGNRDTLESTGLLGTPGLVAAGLTQADDSAPRTTEYHTNSPYAEPFATGFTVPSLQNTEVFDYRNKVYSGGIDRVEREFDAYNFTLEQSFFDNRMAFEIGYDKQHYETLQDFFFQGGNGNSTGSPYDIYINIAEYLQNGQPNPNLGRAYSRVSSPAIRYNEIDRETFRITGFGELDFTERDGWSKFLGRHRITALYNDHTRDNFNRTFREAFSSDTVDVNAYYQANGITNVRRNFNTLVYVSDDLRGTGSMDEIRLNQINIQRPQPEANSYTMLLADVSSSTAPRTLETGSVYLERYLDGESIGQRNIESKAISWQSYFLDNHIIGLYGIREDDTESFSAATESELGIDNQLPGGRWNPNFTRLSTEPSLVESGDTSTWSVVGRYPEVLLGDLPWGMDLQVHYSESENFNPIGLRNDALGREIGQPTGTTKEYGFTTSFLENKLTFKANWFETKINDSSAGVSINLGNFVYNQINSYRDAELQGIPFSDQLVTVNGNPEDFPIQDYPTYYQVLEDSVPVELRDRLNPRQVDEDEDGVWDRIERDPIPNLRSTQDRVAEGFEFEVVANPNPNLRLFSNISRQETILDNSATVLSQLVEAFNLKTDQSRILETRDDGLGVFIERTTAEIWLPNIANLRSVTAKDGTVSNEQRKWRATLGMNYSFTEGRLEGVSIGGSARWEDKAATGYVFVVEDETGLPVPDVSRPFYDDGLFSGDLWLSYGAKLFDDKIDWKIQLNIRNLVGEDDDIPVRTNPDGQVAVVRIPNPRTVYLSNTFRF